MKPGHIHVGISGWAYPQFVGLLYPRTLKPADRLTHYSRNFSSTEINNTYYQMPSPSYLARWKAQTSSDFKFSIKANRWFTHLRPLDASHESLDKLKYFFDSVELLGEKRGPILFQFSDKLGENIQKLNHFFKSMPLLLRQQIVMEFRHPSWHSQSAQKQIRELGIILCHFDWAGKFFQFPVDHQNWVYIRLHGTRHQYQGSYSEKFISDLSGTIQGWFKDGKTIYVYFNNTLVGDAVHDARRLQKALNLKTSGPNSTGLNGPEMMQPSFDLPSRIG